jgi:hypothetical protein
MAAHCALTLAKRVVPLPRLAQLAWSPPRGGARNAQAEARAVGLVLKASRWSGGTRHNCLPRSLLVYRSLSRAGASPRLVVGVRRDRNRVRGHAWVVADDRVRAETGGEAGRYTPILAFGEGGRPAPADTSFS